MASGDKNYDIAKQSTLTTSVGSSNSEIINTSLFGKINNLISTLTTHVANWTSARAEKIDTIATDSASAKADAASNKSTLSTLSTTAETINTNAARLTSARAGYIDRLANSTYGLSALKTAIDNVGGVSITGTGVTVYSKTTAQTHTANSDYGWCSCLTKFIAPKDGLYTLIVDIKSLSSGDGFRIYKFKDRDIGVSTTKYSCLSERIYNSCTIGSKLYLGGYADSSLSTLDSSSDLFHYAISLGTIAKSTSSGTFTFFAKAGEPVILVGNDTYNRTINSVTVTCG